MFWNFACLLIGYYPLIFVAFYVILDVTDLCWLTQCLPYNIQYVTYKLKKSLWPLFIEVVYFICFQQIGELKKENFDLKLRIYFLEERLQQKFGDEDVFKTVSWYFSISLQTYHSVPVLDITLDQRSTVFTLSIGTP